MEMLLIKEKLWSIVCGRKTRPEGGSEDKATKGQLEWDEEAERATAIIFLCLDEMAEHHVVDLRNPVAVWKKLEEVYSSSGFSARSILWRRLFLAEYSTHPTIEAYVDEI